MKNVMKEKWNLLLGNQVGAALLMVILITSFVITLGSSVLFNSYNGYLMKLVDRGGVENFYTTEELLDQVRAGVQTIANECLIYAHGEISKKYGSYTGTELEIIQKSQQDFAELYTESLGKWPNYDSLSTSGAGDVFDFTRASSWKYIPSGLQELLWDDYGTEIIVSTDALGDGPTVHVHTDYNVYENPDGIPEGETIFKMVMKDVQVSYEANGFRSNITTDLTLSVPMYLYASVGGSGYPFGNSAIIGRSGVVVENKRAVYNSDGSTNLDAYDYTEGTPRMPTVHIKGDFYGGVIYVGKLNDGSGDTPVAVEHTGGNWITGNVETEMSDSSTVVTGLEVHDNGNRFIQSADAGLWTSRITVKEKADLTLLGNVVVQEDLIVVGGTEDDPSNIVLGGSYFGFGNGSSALTSSSILFQGDNINLNISGLNSLKLAGSANVLGSGVSNRGNELVMGQSMATLPDQIAYMVPNEVLLGGVTNPMIISSLESEVDRIADIAAVDVNHVLWGTSKIGDYAESEPFILYKTAGDQLVVYFFLDFKESGGSDRTARNSYFGDYFTNRQTEFTDYLSRYLDIFAGNTLQTAVTDGHTYFNEAASDAEMVELNAEADAFAQLYENVRITLQEDDVPVVNLSRVELDPYHYYLRGPTVPAGAPYPYDNTLLYETAVVNNKNGVGHVGDPDSVMEFRDETGTVLAVYFCNSVHVLDSTMLSVYPDVKFIICGNSLTVHSPFTGLAMSGNDIKVSADLTSSIQGINEAMEATITVKFPYDYNSTTYEWDILTSWTEKEIPLKAFFQNIEHVDTSAGDANSNTKWDPDDLVYFENWEKH